MTSSRTFCNRVRSYSALHLYSHFSSTPSLIDTIAKTSYRMAEVLILICTLCVFSRNLLAVWVGIQ